MPDLRRVVRSAAGVLGLVPAQRVFTELRRRGVELGRMRALDVFGADGERMIRFYGPQVATLEIWELDPRYEEELRRKFPGATVRIVDSFDQTGRAEGPYDLVVIDNPIWAREHFDFFPEVFRILSGDSVLVCNVIPAPSRGTHRRYPSLFDQEHLERRRRFYGADRSERIERSELAAHYRALAQDHGFRTEWHFFVRRLEIWYGIPRPQEVYFLCLKLARGGRESASS